MYLELINFTDSSKSVCLTTREGGRSAPPFASLNLAFHTGDDPAIVIANRNLLLKNFNLDLVAVKTVCQVHGKEVRIVEGSSPYTWAAPFEELPSADGLITADDQVGLSVFLADCLAVYIFDPINRVRAILHAGWKSVNLGIIENALMAMNKSFGVEPMMCKAMISPGMKACCFEIKPESFPTSEIEWQAKNIFQQRDGSHYFDLTSTISQRLVKNGLLVDNIEEDKLCTTCDNRFYSYRREGKTGRMAALWL